MGTAPDDDNDQRAGARDPNGTLGVARGAVSGKEASKRRQELEEQVTNDPSIGPFLGGDAARERRRLLQQDDTKPNLGRLNDKQRRALQRRQRSTKAVQAKLDQHDTKRFVAAIAAAQAQQVLQTGQQGVLETDHDLERTSHVTQQQLKRIHLDADVARHIFDLDLPTHAPYGFNYDRSGRHAVLFGQNGGHLAIMDNHTQTLTTEFHVRDRVRDACFLHNSSLFAVAQQNCVYVYNAQGAEVHQMSKHVDPLALQFLPYHFLLASIGRAGYLHYQDTSTGAVVASHRTQKGPCQLLRQNPHNAVLHAGHANGTVTLWSPASSSPLVQMLCHKGHAVTALALHSNGNIMVTGGADKQVKVWDLRTYQCLHAYYTASNGVPTALDISQRGVLGIGHGGHATFWAAEALQVKCKEPYMYHAMPRCGPIETLRFRPFEDVCAIGHARGVSSIVIPGAGEANIDTHEYNVHPHATLARRREHEVRALLDKLSPDMIALDADTIGGVEVSDAQNRHERLQDLQEAANAKVRPAKKQKSKKRGRSKIQTQLRRKKNVVDAQTLRLRQARELEKEQMAAETKKSDKSMLALDQTTMAIKDAAPVALKRFFGK